MLTDQNQTETIHLTPTAVQAVKDLLEQRNIEGYALRIYVAGMGCSGIQYGMALDNNIREEDETYEYDGVTAIVDEVSIQYMRGSTIDFVNDGMGSGFKIDNPNEIPGCGYSSQSQACSGCG